VLKLVYVVKGVAATILVGAESVDGRGSRERVESFYGCVSIAFAIIPSTPDWVLSRGT
jgi:hypothetical protein